MAQLFFRCGSLLFDERYEGQGIAKPRAETRHVEKVGSMENMLHVGM